MLRSVGAAVVANAVHLVEDLPHRRERVELARLHLVQEASELRLVGDRLLQMGLGPARREGEDLAREVLPPALVEEPAGLVDR